MSNEINIGEIILDNEIEIGEIVLDVQKVYPELEEATVQSRAEEQEILPSKYGFSKIIVKPTSSGGGSGGIINPWKDKVISIMGDSISTYAGWIPTDDGHNLAHVPYYPRNIFNDVEKTWWKSLINDLGAKLGVNESWSRFLCWKYIR